MQHGAESYYVVGEGLLGESGEGRDSARVVANAAAAPPFRFSRMGPKGTGRQPGETNRRKLGVLMAAGGGGTSQIPSGFTYLGQFLDHDLTFDKTTVMLGTTISPTALLQARSPSLDLDSLYGAGPQDPESAKFYESDGMHLKVGKTDAADGIPAKVGFDLPRGAGSSAAAKRKAIIPDPRNDENLAVAQTHAAMIRFHNRVLDSLPAALPAPQRFAQARELVTKHYQWMVRTDYLPRICRPNAVDNVFNQGRKVFEVGATPTDVPTMPIEFSVAGFRLGHSMIRAAYNWNKIFDNGSGTLDFLFTFSALGGNLGGGPRLPSNWIADWRRLYDFGEAGRANLTVPAAKFNRAKAIDTHLVDPLANLPAKTFGGSGIPFDDPRRNLAFRNLTRAQMVRLATGQQMATFMKSKGVNFPKLTKAQIRDGKNGVALVGLSAKQSAALLKDTPLWFYILRESELNNGKLRGVGARIVAETFHRAIEGSQFSIVRDPAWRPTLGPNSTTFRMVDLLLFAFEGKKTLLAPGRLGRGLRAARERAQHVAPDQARAGAHEQPVEAEAGAGARVGRGDAGLGRHARPGAGGLDHEVEADLHPARLGERLERGGVELRRVLAAGQPPRLHDAAAEHRRARGRRRAASPARRRAGRLSTMLVACWRPASRAGSRRMPISTRDSARSRSRRSCIASHTAAGGAAIRRSWCSRKCGAGSSSSMVSTVVSILWGTV